MLPPENGFGAYLGFREQFWEQFSRVIILSSLPFTYVLQKIPICKVWKTVYRSPGEQLFNLLHTG